MNGRRAVYIPVTKRPSASTLDVVREVKANLGRFQALVPDDISVSYELDQSADVAASLQAVIREALLGALLTGLVVLVFLRDWRSSAIVVITIPFALLTAVVALWGAGQTINIMTLGGLALAVGILWTRRRSPSRTFTPTVRAERRLPGRCSTRAARWSAPGSWRCWRSSRCSCRRSS